MKTSPTVRRGTKEKNSVGDNKPTPTPDVKAPTPDSNELTPDQVGVMIAASVESAFKANAGDAAKAQEAMIKQVVTDLLARQAEANAKLSKAEIDAIALEAVKQVSSSINKPDTEQRREQKAVNDPSDAGHNRPKIEMECSWVKGNLPVHGKQLLNLLMNPNSPAENVINKGISDSQLAEAVTKGQKTIERYRAMARNGQKALTSTGAATGDEFVPTDLSSELQRRFYLSSDLAARMAATEIEMPSQPYDYPLSTTRPTFYLESTENTTATASTPGTASISLNAKKFMGQVSYSYELDEDSIVPVLATVQSLLSEAAAAAFESALINGDSTATHQDTDTETIAKAAERAFKGFRKLSLAVTALKVDISSGGINEANLRAMKKVLGKYGLNVRNLVWLVGPQGKNDMEAIANVSTLEKYGPKATILTGELSSFIGIPIIGSAAVREDLNASGVDDGVTETKGSINLVNLSEFLTGRRRAFTVEVFRDVKTQTNDIVASFRRAFTPKEVPSATIPTCVVGYNYTV